MPSALERPSENMPDNQRIPALVRGGIARDSTGKIGQIMEVGERRVYLRPQGGGKEWDRPIAEVRPVTTGETMALRVAEENQARKRGRR